MLNMTKTKKATLLTILAVIGIIIFMILFCMFPLGMLMTIMGGFILFLFAGLVATIWNGIYDMLDNDDDY